MPLLTTVHPLYFTTSSLSPFRIQHSVGASQDTTLQHLEIQLKFSPFQIHESPSTAQCLNISAFTNLEIQLTVPTRPNLTESRPQLNPEVHFLCTLMVCFESAMADPELTPNRPQADPEQTQSGHRKQTLISEAEP